MNFLANVLLSVSYFVSHKSVDRLYLEIAVGKTDYSFVWLVVVNTMVLFFVTGLTFKTEIDKIIDKIIDKLEKKKETREKKKAILRFFIKLLFISTIWIFFIGMNVLSYIKIQTIDAFQQHIKILTPYISSETRSKLVSDFAAMKTEEDYKKIYQDIERIARDKDLTLPEKKIQIY